MLNNIETQEALGAMKSMLLVLQANGDSFGGWAQKQGKAAIALCEASLARVDEPVAISAHDVVLAIFAVGKEAAKRGEMFPQTREEQREDRQAERRVVEEIDWYEQNTGCAKLKGWPTVAPQEAAAPGWMSIESAPIGHEMFVVKGVGVKIGSGAPYTTDPYCVWQAIKGKFERWPHPFPPTHYMLLDNTKATP